MQELLIATSNKKKYSEIVAGLSGMPFKLLSLADIPQGPDVEENADTFEDNAILKARGYAARAGILTLAEDSGIEVDALGGRPGVLSARYADGSDEDRCTKLLVEMEGIADGERGAQFRTAIAIFDPSNGKVKTCEGKSEGRLSLEPRGSNGFGYDPIFIYDETGKTGGEMSFAEKLRVSHRGRALIKARDILLAEFSENQV